MDFYIGAIIQGLCLASMAFGIYISMKIFNIPDITTDGSYTLGGALAGVLLAHGLPQTMVIPAVLLGGAAAGAVTGWIHTRLGVNALLAGILVMTGLYSANLTILGRSNVPLMGAQTLFSNVPEWISRDVYTLLILVFCVGLLFLFLNYLLRTDFGLAMRATGDSETMIRALGVHTNRMKIAGLALANAFVATSGALMVQFQGYADINMGIGIVIVGLGSVIIGESLSQTLKFRSVGVILLTMIFGAVAFQLVLAVSLAAGVHPNMLKLVTAIFVLLIVALPRLGIIKLSERAPW